MMNNPLFLLAGLAMIAVVIILGMGISNFGKGTAEAAKKSNKMMKYRIIAQFVAVVLILLFVTLSGGGN